MSSDLSFSKAVTLYCPSSVYYSCKSLFLQNILKCAEGYTSSLKIQTYGIKSHYPSILTRKYIIMLTLACKKEHLFLSRPPSDCLLQEDTCV